MSDKQDKKITGLPTEQPLIFGPSQTREEIRAQQREEKRAARVAAREEWRAEWKKRKDQPREKRPELVVFGVALAVILLGLVVALAVQSRRDARAALFERDETIGSYFVDEEAAPEMVKDGLKAAINKVYYTKGGYLAVEMTLGNGMDKPQHLAGMEVEIVNDDTDEVVAGGSTDDISEKYVVPAGGTNTYRFYISPEHVLVKDDALVNIAYSVTLDFYDAEDSK
ncbi:MAG: hypothetical protein II363_03795 [Clostridia bacterium]|nr:hypothetical protein [Loktanella sp.]MBQ1950702.1 hypothetical protein [Clostridia bacterium]